ncbi:hypothetical protein ACS0TY_015790 [Phlomoides rotata]
MGPDGFEKTGFVRINALLWADILVSYALFVMQDYLTDVWKPDFTHAAGILNIWGAISKCGELIKFKDLEGTKSICNEHTLYNESNERWINPSFAKLFNLQFFAGYQPTGNVNTACACNATGTCKQYEPECIGQTQKVLFYTGMALIAVGGAGNLVSEKPFHKAQDKESRSPTIGFLKIPGFIIVALVPIIGAIALPYVKPWTIRFGIPAICTVIATLVFMTGWCGPCEYTKDKPKTEGSPITNVCRVCLETAAVISDGEDPKENKWRVCSVAEVEEAKIAVRMVPMWMTFVICGIVSSIANTYFVEQAKNMNRHIGKLKVPPQILLLAFDFAKRMFGMLAILILQKVKCEKDEALQDNKVRKTAESSTYTKVAPAIGIGLGMVFSVLCCIIATVIEKRRLGVIRSHGLLDKPDEVLPMNMLWLVFQFVLLAGLDSFLENSVSEFYTHQSPESMKNYLDYFTMGVSGLGFIFSTLCVYVVGKISEKGGKPSWFQDTLNKSRLDRYYWVLAGLSSVNLLVYIFMEYFYRYKDLEARNNKANSSSGGEGGGGGGGGDEQGNLELARKL